MDAIISGKTALKYSGRGIDSMKEIAHAQRKRSLQDFEHAKIYYKKGILSTIFFCEKCLIITSLLFI